MGIKEQIEAKRKAGKGQQLTSTSWDPKEGDILYGELLHREIITRKEDGRQYNKVILKTDAGMIDTIVKYGVLEMAQPPVLRGDFIVLTYNGLIDLKDGKRQMHDVKVEVFEGDHPKESED